MFQKHQVFPVLFFPSGEKMEWLVVIEISFEMEKTIYVLLARRCLRQFIATGQDANGMTPFRQAFGYLVAPLGVAAWPGRGKEVREKKDTHQGLSCQIMELKKSEVLPARYESIYLIHHGEEKCAQPGNLVSNHKYHNQQ